MISTLSVTLSAQIIDTLPVSHSLVDMIRDWYWNLKCFHKISFHIQNSHPHDNYYIILQCAGGHDLFPHHNQSGMNLVEKHQEKCNVWLQLDQCQFLEHHDNHRYQVLKSLIITCIIGIYTIVFSKSLVMHSLGSFSNFDSIVITENNIIQFNGRYILIKMDFLNNLISAADWSN